MLVACNMIWVFQSGYWHISKIIKGQGSIMDKYLKANPPPLTFHHVYWMHKFYHGLYSLSIYSILDEKLEGTDIKMGCLLSIERMLRMELNMKLKNFVRDYYHIYNTSTPFVNVVVVPHKILPHHFLYLLGWGICKGC